MSDETKRLVFEHLKRCRDDRLELLLKAAKFMDGRDRARARDVMAAMGLNRTLAAYAMADSVMAAGGYMRQRGEYRKPHNVEVTGPQRRGNA
jgi:uncharacterized protein HemY